MAELNAHATPAWSGSQTRAQWAAIAELRWRMFRNGLSRPGGKGDLVATLVLYPLLAVLAAGPVAAAGLLAFYLVHTGQQTRVPWLFWGVFALGQLVNINLGQQKSSFDPNQLIRFPLRLRTFVLLRLLFGLLSPANVLMTLMGCAMAIGFAAASPSLAAYAIVAVGVFTLSNVLFSRMVFAWVDRWLSTRRAREIFTALIFLASLGFQYVNISVNTGGGRRGGHAKTIERWHTAAHAYDRVEPVLVLLPPELTAAALRHALEGQRLGFVRGVTGCGLYCALFFTVFALRMRTEFQGEALGDEANAIPRTEWTPARTSTPGAGSAAAVTRWRWLSEPVHTLLWKEILYTRRNTGAFYSLVAPLAMVLLFAGRLSNRNSTPWIFPASLAYCLMGVLPLTFNSFGLESTGSQFFFLAPVPLRDVVLAKNLLAFALAAFEATATLVVISFNVGKPALPVLVASLLWAAATLLIGTSLGNRRSLGAPRLIKLNKAGGKQVSPLSALLSLGLLVLCAVAGAVTLALARVWHLPWVSSLTFALLLAIALLVYLRTLHGMDRYGSDHREQFFAELCKE